MFLELNDTVPVTYWLLLDPESRMLLVQRGPETID